MDFIVYAILGGLLVGGLVGLSGLGGAVLMLPLLILGLGVPPLTAVGTDIVFSFFTKIGGTAMHWRQGNVDWRLALAMAIGSAPGALAGVAALAYLRANFGAGVNDILRSLIGVLLIAIPVLLIVEGEFRRRSAQQANNAAPPAPHFSKAALTGLVGGLLVGLTSVGSGSVILLLLLLFYRRPPRVLVGTDIFHAVILTGVAGLAHLRLGTVDLPLVGWLLVGSLPGVLLGSVFAGRVPGVWLRRVLLVLLILVGIRMI